jgi:sporulation integral membrane protein YtvI
MNSEEKRSLKTHLWILLRTLYVLGAAALLIAALYFAVRLALPLVLACVLSAFLNPMITALVERTGLSRSLATFVVLLLLFSLTLSALFFLAMTLVNGLSSFSRTIPENLSALTGDLQSLFFSRLLPSWEKAIRLYSGLSPDHQHLIQLNIEKMAGTLIQFLNDLGTRLLSGLTQFISSLPEMLVSVLFIFLAAFFLSKDSETIRSRLITIPLFSSLIESVQKIWKDLKRTCTGFIRAQLLLVMMTMSLIFLGLLILRVDHAFAIAFIAGLFDLIPYLGTGVIFIPWIFYAFLVHHLPFAVCLTALYTTAVIQRQLTEPKMLANGTGLDPLLLLIVIYFGFRWFGFPGMLTGPILLILIRAFIRTGSWHRVWHYILNGNMNWDQRLK